MKVLLLHPQVFSPGFSYAIADPRRVSLGLLYIASVLDKAGYDVSVGLATKGNIRRIVEKTSPEVVGFSVITPDYPYTKELVKSVREESPKTRIVLGGYHPTFCANEVLKETGADFVARGEGENVMLQLVKAVEGKIKLSDVMNLSYSRGNEILHNKSGPLVDVNKLPYPAREKVNIQIPTINESRGCPYNCTFCCIRNFYGGTWRPRKIDKLIAEIVYMKEKLGYKRILFQSDNFLVSPKRVEAICKAIIEQGLNDLSYDSTGRVDKLAENPRLIALLSKAGWTSMNFGLESGVQEILDNSYKKKMKLQQVKIVAKKLQRANIEVRWTFIIGSGDEYDSREYIQKSVNFLISSIPYDIVALSIFTPFPGVALFQQLQKENRILTYDWGLYDAMHCVYKPKHLSPKEMEELYSEAAWKIYTKGGPFKLIKRAIRTLKANSLSPIEIFRLLKLGIRIYGKGKDISKTFDYYADKYHKKIEELCRV
jgi:anaerobic magnesium-protoporphyrin IX monomethyl ester cyclase